MSTSPDEKRQLNEAIALLRGHYWAAALGGSVAVAGACFMVWAGHEYFAIALVVLAFGATL